MKRWGFLAALCLPVFAAAQTLGSWTSLPAGDHPRGLAVGDLDGDGIPDLAVANFGAPTFIGQDVPKGSAGSLQVFSPSPSGLRLTAEAASGPGSRGVAITSLEGGGAAVLVTVYGENRLKSYSLKNRALVLDGEAETAARPVGVAAGAVEPGGARVAAVACYGESKVSFFTLDGKGAPSGRQDVATAPGPTGVALGDFDGDGRMEAAVACIGSSKVQVLSRKGGAWAVAATLDLPEGASPADIRAGDLNGDGRTDLAVVLFNQKALAVFLQNPGGLFDPMRTVPTGTDSPNGLAVGALGRGGKTVVAVAGRDSDRLSLFRFPAGVPQLLDTVPVAEESEAHAMGPVEAVILDTDRDGHAEVVVSHLRSGTLRILHCEREATPTPTPAAPGGAVDPQPLSDRTTLAYPNPSSGPVKLRFTLDKPADVDVTVLDVTGAVVYAFRVPAGETQTGSNEAVWRALTHGGAPVASGTYVVKISSGGRSVVKKVFIRR